MAENRVPLLRGSIDIRMQFTVRFKKCGYWVHPPGITRAVLCEVHESMPLFRCKGSLI